MLGEHWVIILPLCGLPRQQDIGSKQRDTPLLSEKKKKKQAYDSNCKHYSASGYLRMSKGVSPNKTKVEQRMTFFYLFHIQLIVFQCYLFCDHYTSYSSSYEILDRYDRLDQNQSIYCILCKIGDRL